MNRFSVFLLAWVRGRISLRQATLAKAASLLAYWGILRP